MEHQNLEKMTSTAPMLPTEEVKFPARINNCGKILIREDTAFLTNGCVGCSRGQFACTGMKESWSVLCWGRQSEKKYYCLLLLLSATFVLSLLGTVFFCFTNTINDAILSNMVIRNNSLAYSVWKRPSVQPLMKVHLFNYTNWRELRNGTEGHTRLRVQELGPYVYSQQLERVNIKFNKDRITFQERNHFQYLPEITAGAHYDQIDVPNLPLLGIIGKAAKMSLFARGGAMILTNNHPAFINLPVHKFLWGYSDDLITAAKISTFFQGELMDFTDFGLLVSKNGTGKDTFTINTGEFEKEKMNVFEEVNAKKALPYWSDENCNSIDATDGSIFPPSQVEAKQTLYIYLPNLCRRVPFVFEKEVEISNGVILYRYKMPNNVFDDPKHNPSNQCFCDIDSGDCPLRGVIDVSPCTMGGASAVVSFPHFYLGDPILREDVLGLNPDASRHESYVDIHPKLGIALQGRSSLQINMQVKCDGCPFPSVGYLKNKMILPVAWVELSVEELPESLKSLVYHGTYSTAAVQLGLTVICVIALIVSSICLFLLIVQKRQKPCATLKKIPVELLNVKLETKQDSTS